MLLLDRCLIDLKRDVVYIVKSKTPDCDFYKIESLISANFSQNERCESVSYHSDQFFFFKQESRFEKPQYMRILHKDCEFIYAIPVRFLIDIEYEEDELVLKEVMEEGRPVLSIFYKEYEIRTPFLSIGPVEELFLRAIEWLYLTEERINYLQNFLNEICEIMKNYNLCIRGDMFVTGRPLSGVDYQICYLDEAEEYELANFTIKGDAFSYHKIIGGSV